MKLDLDFSGTFEQRRCNSAFQYHFKLVLENPGITAVYGGSGEGKTTLLRLISGLEKTSTGKISLDGKPWQSSHHFVSPEDRKLAYVFQEGRLFPALSIEANVLYGLGGKWRKLDSETKTLVNEVCEQLGIRDWFKRYPKHLSGGQKQRVALARCLVCRPRLLLLDEPFSSMDEDGKAGLLRYLANFVFRYQIPCLFVSHSRFEIESIASHAILIQHGRVIAQDTVADLVTRLDLALSHEEQSTSLLRATLKAHDTEYCLSELTLGSQTIWVQKLDTVPGEQLTLRILARDVIVSTLAPVTSSVLNHIEGEIIEIEHTHDSRVLLLLKVDRQKLLARITRKSLMALALKVGQGVYVQFKSVGLGATLTLN